MHPRQNLYNAMTGMVPGTEAYNQKMAGEAAQANATGGQLGSGVGSATGGLLGSVPMGGALSMFGGQTGGLLGRVPATESYNQPQQFGAGAEIMQGQTGAPMPASPEDQQMFNEMRDGLNPVTDLTPQQWENLWKYTNTGEMPPGAHRHPHSYPHPGQNDPFTGM